MREVKEKSSLKARAVETLKSAPQAAFRRGTDASFQQLRQELREAAQDGQPEDRYESGKITDTADHAVQEARHLAEKAAHRLPKTKSEPQREARTESNPQHEQSRQPQQPTVAPKEYPPASARPSYPPQSQPQVSRSVHESASPIREKPVPPANAQQPKTRVYTPDAKAPASPSQYPTPRIHENATAVSAETMPSTMEHSVRESASSIKEKTIPPTNPPQPKMREHTPTADASVQQSRHPASEIHEKPQAVHHAQVNRSVRELETSVRKSLLGKQDRQNNGRLDNLLPARNRLHLRRPRRCSHQHGLCQEKNRLFPLRENRLPRQNRIPHSSRFLQSRRKSTSERNGKSRSFSKKKQAVSKMQPQIPKHFRQSSVHGKLFVNSKNSTFPIVRSRSSQPCRRFERGSHRQFPCTPIQNPRRRIPRRHCCRISRASRNTLRRSSQHR